MSSTQPKSLTTVAVSTKDATSSSSSSSSQGETSTVDALLAVGATFPLRSKLSKEAMDTICNHFFNCDEQNTDLAHSIADLFRCDPLAVLYVMIDLVAACRGGYRVVLSLDGLRPLTMDAKTLRVEPRDFALGVPYLIPEEFRGALLPADTLPKLIGGHLSTYSILLPRTTRLTRDAAHYRCKTFTATSSLVESAFPVIDLLHAILCDLDSRLSGYNEKTMELYVAIIRRIALLRHAILHDEAAERKDKSDEKDSRAFIFVDKQANSTFTTQTKSSKSIPKAMEALISLGKAIFAFQNHVRLPEDRIPVMIAERVLVSLRAMIARTLPVPDPLDQTIIVADATDVQVYSLASKLKTTSPLWKLLQLLEEKKKEQKDSKDANPMDLKQAVAGLDAPATSLLSVLWSIGQSHLFPLRVAMYVENLYVRISEVRLAAALSLLDPSSGLSPSTYFCAKCGLYATLRCGRCKSVRYCSGECQRTHFSSHKMVCVPATK